MSMINIPVAGNVQQIYEHVVNYCKLEVDSNINLSSYGGSLSEVIHPCTNLFEKWFQQKLPLRDVRAIFFVRNFLSPREFHVRKASKMLTGRESMTEEDLIKEGILILPFTYFEVIASAANNIYLIDEVAMTCNIINAFIISEISVKNPRERLPIIIVEDEYDQYNSFSQIYESYMHLGKGTQATGILDFGLYIDSEIPPTEMPIKLGHFYFLNTHSKREPKVIKQFISQICHKL